MTRRPARRPSARRPSTRRTALATSFATWVAVLVGLLVGLLTVGGLVAPAAAHDAMTGSTPADGSTVDVPPTSVDLTFSEPPLELGAEVRVTGPDGEVVNDGDLVLSGTTVSQPLVAELPAGAYAVAWRVTSSDGHPISGELTFTAATGTTEPAPSPSPTEPTDEATEPAEEPEPSAEPVEPGDEPAAGAEPPAAAPGDGVEEPVADPPRGAVPWFIAGVVLLAAAAATWWAARQHAATRGRD